MNRLLVPLFVLYSGSLLAIKFPYWLLKYTLFPSARARPSWTVAQQVTVLFLRNYLQILVRTGGTASRNIDLPLLASNTLVHAHAIELKPLDKSYLKGIIEKAAKDVGGLDVVLKNGTNKVGPRRIPAYWYTAKKSKSEQLSPLSGTESDLVVLYLHGGAYIIGTAHEQDDTSKIARTLVNGSAVTRILSVDYRLAGLAPFPGALIDALAGYKYLVEDCKIPPSRIVIAGDSAGANLTMALTRYLRDEKVFPMPAALLLLSPWGDMSESHWTAEGSAYTNSDSDYVFAEFGGKGVSLYLKGHPASFKYNPYVSPASREMQDEDLFTGFPKAFIHAGGGEALLDEIVYLRDRYIEGVGQENVQYEVTPDAPHDLMFLEKWGPPREKSFGVICDWLAKEFPEAAKAKKAAGGHVRPAKKDL